MSVAGEKALLGRLSADRGSYWGGNYWMTQLWLEQHVTEGDTAIIPARYSRNMRIGTVTRVLKTQIIVEVEGTEFRFSRSSGKEWGGASSREVIVGMEHILDSFNGWARAEEEETLRRHTALRLAGANWMSLSMEKLEQVEKLLAEAGAL